MRDLVVNLAKTALASDIDTGAMSFTVTTGTASKFPNPTTSVPGNLIVAIETELVLCSSYSGNTFTVVTRGYDGTTTASHSAGALVEQVMTAQYLNHLWSNLPDRYQLDVPPSFRSGIQGTYDDEFEASSGLWTLYPSDAGMTLSYGSSYKSWAFFKRLTSQTTSYYLYKSFAPGAAFTATCRLSHGGTITGASAQAWAWFFVSDQINPTGSLTSGNRALLGVGMDYRYTMISNGGALPMSVIQQINTSSGSISVSNMLMDSGYLYLQIQYDGSSVWTYRASRDGIAFTTISQVTQAITPATIGWVFQANSTPITQQAGIDWLRITTP